MSVLLFCQRCGAFVVTKQPNRKWCSKCRRPAARDRLRHWRTANREQFNAQQRAYRAENRERYRQRWRFEYAKTRACRLARARRYRIKDSEKLRTKDCLHYAEHRHKILERHRRRRAENGGKMRALERARNAFYEALEDVCDPTARKRRRNKRQRYHDRRTIYRAVLEEVGPGILTVLDELKQEELKQEELKQLESKGDES
jgi:hypothetical protein